ncbi:MAG: hypothetical protein QM504_05400 [Pseudomonadota bacterium]
MNKPTNKIFKFLIIIFISLLYGCQGNPDKLTNNSVKNTPKGSKQCGITRGSFLGSWFDYYERALSFADCEMWFESEHDLKKALNKRSVDKRRVYSLGMHLVADYFPHRELGISYYYQKKYSAAKIELAISLSQFPTSKAEEYLKRIRQEIIKKQNKDTQAPQIHLKTPTQNQMMKNSEVAVSGTVIDNNFIDSLTINNIPYRYVPSFVSKNGVPVRIARKVPKMDFNLTVPVKFTSGKGIVSIVAKDISGNISIKEIPISLDQQGPQISIKTVRKKNQAYHLVLNVSDQQSKVKYLEINNKIIAIKSKQIIDKKTNKKVNEVYIDKLIGGPFDKQHMLIIAIDDIGNKTRAKIKLEKKTEKPSDLDTDAPALEIFLSKDQEQRITLEKFVYLEGEVESESSITSLTLNGKNIINTSVSGENKHIYFNYLYELKEGLNTIILITKNKYNKTQRKSIDIVRKLPPNRALSERLKIAQFPFPCNIVSKIPCFVSAPFYEQLNNALNLRKRFQITNIQQLNSLLDETGSCEKGVSDECVVKIADRLVNKNIWQSDFDNAMFVGSVIERTNLKGKVSVEISGRMINNKTREVLTSVDIYADNIIKKNFKSFSKSMVIEISDAFPLLEAEVIQKMGDNLQVDLSEKDHIWEHMPVLVYQSKNNQNCGNGSLFDINKTTSFVNYKNNQCDNKASDSLRIITR